MNRRAFVKLAVGAGLYVPARSYFDFGGVSLFRGNVTTIEIGRCVVETAEGIVERAYRFTLWESALGCEQQAEERELKPGAAWRPVEGNLEITGNFYSGFPDNGITWPGEGCLEITHQREERGWFTVASESGTHIKMPL